MVEYFCQISKGKKFVRGKSTLKCKIASKSREPRITPTQYHATGSPYSLSPLNTTLIFIIVMHEKKEVALLFVHIVSPNSLVSRQVLST